MKLELFYCKYRCIEKSSNSTVYFTNQGQFDRLTSNLQEMFHHMSVISSQIFSLAAVTEEKCHSSLYVDVVLALDTRILEQPRTSLEHKTSIQRGTFLSKQTFEIHRTSCRTRHELQQSIFRSLQRNLIDFQDYEKTVRKCFLLKKDCTESINSLQNGILLAQSFAADDRNHADTIRLTDAQLFICDCLH